MRRLRPRPLRGKTCRSSRPARRLGGQPRPRSRGWPPGAPHRLLPGRDSRRARPAARGGTSPLRSRARPPARGRRIPPERGRAFPAGSRTRRRCARRCAPGSKGGRPRGPARPRSTTAAPCRPAGRQSGWICRPGRRRGRGFFRPAGDRGPSRRPRRKAPAHRTRPRGASAGAPADERPAACKSSAGKTGPGESETEARASARPPRI